MEDQVDDDAYLTDVPVEVTHMDDYRSQTKGGQPEDCTGVRWLKNSMYDLTLTNGVLGMSMALLSVPAKQTTDIVQQHTKRLVSPFMMLCAVFVIGVANQRKQKSKLTDFQSELHSADVDLNYLRQNIPKLVDNIQSAGKMLHVILSCRKETGEEESSVELDSLFDEINTDLSVSKDIVKSAKGSLSLLREKLQSYGNRAMFNNFLLAFGVGVTSTVAYYHDLLTQNTTLGFIAISLTPVCGTVLFLPADINDLKTAIRQKTRMYQGHCSTLENIDKRLTLVKKHQAVV